MDYSCNRYLNFVTHSGCRILYLSFVVLRVITGCIFEVNRFEHFAECESIAASCFSEVSKLESSCVSSLQQKLNIEHCFTEYWDKLYTYRLSLIVASILQRKPRVGVAYFDKMFGFFRKVYIPCLSFTVTWFAVDRGQDFCWNLFQLKLFSSVYGTQLWYKNLAWQLSRRSILLCVYHICWIKTTTTFAQFLSPLLERDLTNEQPPLCLSLSWMPKRNSSS